MFPWLARMDDAMRPRQVVPLRVRLWFRQPVSWEPDGLHLDGALSWMAVAHVTGEVPQDVFSGYRGPPVNLPLPLASVDWHGHALWACSWAAPPPEAHAVEGVRLWRKRANVDHYCLPGKVITSGGPYKSLNIPRAVLHTPCLDTYLRGDPDLLRPLLANLSRLGRAGLGSVAAVEVTDAAEDRALVWQDRPQRSLPVPDEATACASYAPGSYALRVCSVRPPYWHRASETLCVVPLATAQGLG